MNEHLVYSTTSVTVCVEQGDEVTDAAAHEHETSVIQDTHRSLHLIIQLNLFIFMTFLRALFFTEADKCTSLELL